jgi:hypothetical protein
VLALSVLGWWGNVLFDESKSGPKWIWILPIAAAAIIVNNFLGVPSAKLSDELLVWSSLGALGVGFGEEMITRGSMVVGLRSRFSEGKVWLICSLLFSALQVAARTVGQCAVFKCSYRWGTIQRSICHLSAGNRLHDRSTA